MSQLPELCLALKWVGEPSFRQTFPSAHQCLLPCINQAQYREVLEEVNLCEKMAKSDAEKFAESQSKKDTSRRVEGLPKEKQTPRLSRKREKDSCPSSEEEMDGREQAPAAEPEVKDPSFTHLPKSPFVLDEFMCNYANGTPSPVVLPYL